MTITKELLDEQIKQAIVFVENAKRTAAQAEGSLSILRQLRNLMDKEDAVPVDGPRAAD